MVCLRCGKELLEGGAFCPHCGIKTNQGNPSSLVTPTEEEYQAYIGPRAEHYLSKFSKFNKYGMDRFALTWHWPAFFIGFWWLLYRKMYFWSLIAFGVWWFPHLALPGMFIWGAVGNYVYYLQAKRKILDSKTQLPEVFSLKSLTELGGVNRWVWVLGFILSILLVGGLGLGLLLLYRFINQSFMPVQDYLETGLFPGWLCV